MPKSNENADKARFIFEQVFAELGVSWVGPEWDFDRDCYKARVQGGDLKGQLKYISVNDLDDRDVSAESIKQALLSELRRALADKAKS